MSRPLTIYIRHGCHRCENMLQEFNLRQESLEFRLQTVDISDKLELETLYGTKVPVLSHAGVEVCHYFLDEAALQRCFEDCCNPLQVPYRLLVRRRYITESGSRLEVLLRRLFCCFAVAGIEVN